MAKAALNFRGLSVSEKITRSRATVKAIAASPFFQAPNPVPNPPLSTVSATIDALEEAEKKVDEYGGGKKWTGLRDGREKELDKVMAQVTRYVDYAANGNEEVIQAAALHVKKPSVKKGKLPAVQNLLAKASETEGTVLLTWKGVKGAASYKALMSEDASRNTWKEFPKNIATDTQMIISDLKSGAKLWFIVIPINAAGEGDPCDPAMVRVQ